MKTDADFIAPSRVSARHLVNHAPTCSNGLSANHWKPKGNVQVRI